MTGRVGVADRARLAHAARFTSLAGLSAGLAAAPFVLAGEPARVAALGAACACALLAAGSRATGRRAGAPGAGVAVGLAGFALACGLVGLGAGTARVRAIDAGALTLSPGTHVTVTGFVTAVPRRTDGQVRVRVETADGRLMVEAPEPVGDLTIGTRVRAAGVVREPGDWERSYLRRLGIANVLAAAEIAPLPGTRGGLTGRLDAIRARAEQALAAGTSPAASALLRGFVLGEDDRIDPRTADEFKRSGLAHLLAVSGMNIVLLAVLAGVVLAAAGVPLRQRLLCILGLIAVYVPVAGGGPSIQRAGLMGAAGVVAALAGRPRSRWYAVLAALAGTLALDPRASGDIGWQLSFAAVIGILLASAPIGAALAGPRPGRVRAALAEGAGLTIAATLATAPLIAFHFGTLSIVTLPANLLAAPLEAPVMWLGMLAAALGQQSVLPVTPITWLGGTAVGYVAQVASWTAAPSWAQLQVASGDPRGLAASYALLGLSTWVVLRWARRRRGLRSGRSGRHAARVIALALAVLVALLTAAVLPAGKAPSSAGLRIDVLDVGQGEATLLRPADGAPVLVDAGPPDADVAGQLDALGVDRLAALAISHPQLDHEGGAAAVLARIPTGRLAFARVGAPTLGAARRSGARPLRIAAGDSIGSGSLHLRALWPSAAALRARAPGSDANLTSLVLLARFHGFELLLPGDAEAESAPLDPGPIEALEVSHHGSADAGLEALLDRSTPQLAVVSVGAGNPYGHPTAPTLATLAAHGVRVLRTDEDGAVSIEVAPDGASFAAVAAG